MVVLWLTNTPCGAAEVLTGKPATGGGWMSSLASHVAGNSDIELHIAFYYGKTIEPFTYKNITYHPILREGDSSKAGRYINRLILQFSDRQDYKDIPRLLDTIRKVHPDIIHIHGSEENFGLLAEYDDLRGKIVLSVQGMLNPCLGKLYSGYAKADILKRESIVSKILFDGENACNRIFKRKARREVRIYRNVRYVIGRTGWDKDCSLAFNPERKYFTVNEILRPEFYTRRWQAPQKDDSFTIVTTISNGLYKGLETVYYSAKLLADAGIEFKWRVIGLSEKDSIVKLTESISGMKHSALSIEFCGRLDAPSMLEVLLGSELYVQVSHIENSPNALCEAMVLGMPIIATFAGGTSGILEDGKEGLLVQDGDPYRMAGAIISYIQDPSPYSETGDNARKKAAQRHSPEQVLDELLEAYKTIQKDRE